jgi:hypothetical protein
VEILLYIRRKKENKYFFTHAPAESFNAKIKASGASLKKYYGYEIISV